ncbi:MAG: hypothetical protein JSS02_14480 [Planctomycetes bacterium]|nr:hypothetical protein [Planctomycetota bacterium]
MANSIDWYYQRPGCKTCGKMDSLLEELSVSVKTAVNAKKVKMGPAEAQDLLKGVKQVVATKGKAVVDFDLSAKSAKADELLPYLIGPTGNLRAPTIRLGKTLFVGFDRDKLQGLLA